jgi:uncharacterized protein (DUF58 family)
LLVKRYQPAIARETLVCLDLDTAGYDDDRRYMATELAIVTAASIATHIAVNEKLPVGLSVEAWDPLVNGPAHFFLPPRSERASLMNLLEVLARVQVAPAPPFASRLRSESPKLSWGSTLAVITGRASEALFDTLLYLRRAGFAVGLILVQPPRLSEEAQKRADMSGVPIHRVWNERGLGTGPIHK